MDPAPKPLVSTYRGDVLVHLRSFAALVRQIEAGPGRLRPKKGEPMAGAVDRTALALHVDKSVLRRRIATLEGAVRTPLLRGRGSALTPTDAGKRLVALAGRLEADIDAEFSRSRGAPPQVTFGCTGTVTTELLPFVFAALERRWSDIELRIRRAGSVLCRELTLRAEIDVGILRSPEVPIGLGSTHLAEDRLSVVLPRRHALATGRIDAKRLAKEPLISYGEGSQTGRRVMERLGPLGARVKLEVDGKAAAVEYAALGFGVAIVSLLPAHRLARKDLVVRDVTSLFRRVSFWIVWDEARPLSPAAELARAELVRVANLPRATVR